MRGQADRIGRAVSNLVDNARKWSPAGAAVEVALKDGVLSVRDHGPGFQEADLPFVFDRFYRARDARKLPGSGLGLAIVRQAAEACGGFAEAQNAPGGGALLRVGFGAPVELAPGWSGSSGWPRSQSCERDAARAGGAHPPTAANCIRGGSPR